jgi:Fur family transcriptional regulator, ferric uptake regulator
MKEYVTKLRENRLKLTPRRVAIIELFQAAKRHLTPEEVWKRLKKRFNTCGFPTIYRNLESLVACGVLVKIQKFDRKRHYGLCTARKNTHHHHIVCVKCGRVDNIPGCEFSHVRTINGYTLLSHYIQLNGVCSSCGNG